MKKAALLTMLLIHSINFVAYSQKNTFRKKIEKEISTYPKAFAQRVIFDVSRYFRMRGGVLAEVKLHFRGMQITRRQLSANTCIYEFHRKYRKIILSESDVRKLVGLPPNAAVLYARKPTN